ncbi:MAG: HAD-IIIA family hydrolase [Bacteroidetes bacterium]|nr:HAD-IIIA family hydrolase [Bacteroidota bacterium]
MNHCNLLNVFKSISCFVFDVDGVLTDGSLLVFDDGQMVRRMHVRDGYALQLAIKKGYRVVIISGGDSEAVRQRLNKLGVHDVYMKVENKKKVLDDYLTANGIPWQEVLFMGDDIPDYEVMREAGLSCCPADAANEIKHISQYISTFKGGNGCARDVIEKVLKLNQKWDIDVTVSSK